MLVKICGDGDKDTKKVSDLYHAHCFAYQKGVEWENWGTMQAVVSNSTQATWWTDSNATLTYCILDMLLTWNGYIPGF